MDQRCFVARDADARAVIRPNGNQNETLPLMKTFKHTCSSRLRRQISVVVATLAFSGLN